MEKILSEIDKCKSNINIKWFYTSVAQRFSIIEKESNKTAEIEKEPNKTAEIKKAAKEIIILYTFYMDHLKENNQFAKHIIRDYYYDYQYIKTLELIPDYYGPYLSYKNDRKLLENLFELLPKNSHREEALRDSAYTGIAAQQKVHDSDIQPEAAREYLLNAIR
jgi:hypothetical protein